MGVLTQSVARGDWLLRRGVSESFAVRWTWDEGSGFKPKDLSEWEAVCELLSPAGDLWASLECETTVDGLAIARFSDAFFVGSEWAPRAQGQWRMNATSPSGHVERLGDGYFYLEG